MKAGDTYKDVQLGSIYTLITWGDRYVTLEYNGRTLQLTHEKFKQEFKKA
jgi:hypothetical protein